jgi:hypothetical protein
MCLFRHHNGQTASRSLFPNVGRSPNGAGGEQGSQVSQCATGGKQSTSFVAQGQLFGQPLDYDALQCIGGHAHLVHSHTLIEQPRHQAGQSRQGQWWANLVAHALRMMQMNRPLQHRSQQRNRIDIGRLGKISLPIRQLFFRQLVIQYGSGTGFGSR